MRVIMAAAICSPVVACRRGTLSRLAFRRRALRGFSWHAGRRSRVAIVPS